MLATHFGNTVYSSLVLHYKREGFTSSSYIAGQFLQDIVYWRAGAPTSLMPLTQLSPLTFNTDPQQFDFVN